MMRRTSRAFTLLELLAAVALLVLLGSMLFQIFGKSSEVVRISNARQEVFQYARAALEFIEREIMGAFASVDANPTTGNKGMRVYDSLSMGPATPRREDTQSIFFSTGVMARDVSGSPTEGAPDYNPFFGHDVNVARIAYYLNRGPTDPSSSTYNHLEHSAIYRSEAYDLTQAQPEVGGPFVRNCLFFNILVFNQFDDPPRFQTMDWNSDETITVDGNSRRRGLPKAVWVKMRITDAGHATLYKWDSSHKEWRVPGPDGTTTKDYWGEEDPVVQSFSQIVYFGRRSD